MEPMSQHESEFNEAMLKLNELENRIAKLELSNQIDKSKRYLFILSQMVFEYFIKGDRFPNYREFVDIVFNKSCDVEDGIITTEEYNDWLHQISPTQINIGKFNGIITKCCFDIVDIDIPEQENYLCELESFEWPPSCDNFSYDIKIVKQLIQELRLVPKYRRIVNPN